jgi:hypothetical protein
MTVGAAGVFAGDEDFVDAEVSEDEQSDEWNGEQDVVPVAIQGGRFHWLSPPVALRLWR